MQGITMKETEYNIHRKTKLGYEKAIAAVTAELQKEGFGILTEIDVAATLRKKLDIAFPRYIILGACNPKLAHAALSAEPDIGLLLPCNVVVSESLAGTADLSALKPTVVFSKLVETPGVDAVSQDAEARLTRALDVVAAMG